MFSHGLGRFGPLAKPAVYDRYLATAVVPRAVLTTCHVKPTLTLARARTGGEERAPPQKILKAPLRAQLGIDETSSDALNEKDAELNSENSSAPGETGRQSPLCES